MSTITPPIAPTHPTPPIVLSATQRKRLRLKNKKKTQAITNTSKPTDFTTPILPEIKTDKMKKEEKLKALKDKLRGKSDQQKARRSAGWTREKAKEHSDKQWEDDMRKLFSNMNADSIDMYIEQGKAKFGTEAAQRLRALKNERFGAAATHADSEPALVKSSKSKQS